MQKFRGRRRPRLDPGVDIAAKMVDSPVGLGQPSCLIDEMTIGGTRVA